jgi:hypothetical protein
MIADTPKTCRHCRQLGLSYDAAGEFCEICGACNTCGLLLSYHCNDQGRKWGGATECQRAIGEFIRSQLQKDSVNVHDAIVACLDGHRITQSYSGGQSRWVCHCGFEVSVRGHWDAATAPARLKVVEHKLAVLLDEAW